MITSAPDAFIPAQGFTYNRCLLRRGQPLLHPQGVYQINSARCRLSKRHSLP